MTSLRAQLLHRDAADTFLWTEASAIVILLCCEFVVVVCMYVPNEEGGWRNNRYIAGRGRRKE